MPVQPATVSVRTQLIAEVLAFTHAARELPGVRRIALLGSLVSEKPEPKDADVLVTISDDADLAPLAVLGRRLQGHAQSLNRGADIFLANEYGRYLGRICHWKQCAPGIRLSCDASHCGRRPYLHDDWDDIRLDRALISAPPLELWPRLLARTRIPGDVEIGLCKVLRETAD